MIPELGKYAGVVLSAYGVSLLLLAGLLLVTFAQGRKARKGLSDVEGETRRDG